MLLGFLPYCMGAGAGSGRGAPNTGDRTSFEVVFKEDNGTCTRKKDFGHAKTPAM